MMRAAALLVVLALGCAPTPHPPTTAPMPPPPSPATTTETPRRSTASTGEQPLGARGHPFAVYIVAMHRQIHPRFTDGFLADLDARHDPAFADDKLVTELRLAVAADGSLAAMRVLRPSGNARFDNAALASVGAAVPFPPTPELIRSADGKVWVDWKFHRDAVLSCGTPGVWPHIFGVPPPLAAAAPEPVDPRTAYVAAVHRRIHAQFAVGYLAYLESNPHSPDLDDPKLTTELAIVVRSDGTIDHADITHPSGMLAFDVAVLDSTLSSAPFPAPPPAMRDTAGLTQLAWTFHRDERECGPNGDGAGADPLSKNLAPPASEKALQ